MSPPLAVSVASSKHWVLEDGVVRWAKILFAISVVYFAWFLVVVVGEIQEFGDNPGAWAGMPTELWAFFGGALFTATMVICLSVLVRREVPGRKFVVAADGRVQ